MMVRLLKRAGLWGMPGAVLATSLVCAAVTVVIALHPELQASNQSSALRVALETAASVIALLAAFLMISRFRRRRLLNELMLACAITALALSDLLFGTLPVLSGPVYSGLTAWASLSGSMLGALIFALAAYLPRAEVRRTAFALPASAVAATAVLAVTAGLISSVTIDAAAPQVVLALLYDMAVIGFLARSEQFGNEFLGWLAIAALLAGTSHISYALYPALDLGSAYVGEAFRLIFYIVLLVGSIREIWSYWRVLSDTAVLEERRRVARDLHDGVTQELAYMARNLDLLAEKPSAETVERLRRAVERAQAESRQAIYALTATAGQTVQTTLAEMASEIAERFNVELAFHSDPDVRLSEPRTEALLRIACEALTNAARHSGARLIRLTLTRQGQRVRLRVSDAGCGFNPDATDGGFGLVSLRERARSVGGELRIISAPGRGSEVEAVL
jgi:signal transduction histidine kinase